MTGAANNKKLDAAAATYKSRAKRVVAIAGASSDGGSIPIHLHHVSSQFSCRAE